MHSPRPLVPAWFRKCLWGLADRGALDQTRNPAHRAHRLAVAQLFGKPFSGIWVVNTTCHHKPSCTEHLLSVSIVFNFLINTLGLIPREGTTESKDVNFKRVQRSLLLFFYMTEPWTWWAWEFREGMVHSRLAPPGELQGLRLQRWERIWPGRN